MRFFQAAGFSDTRIHFKLVVREHDWKNNTYRVLKACRVEKNDNHAWNYIEKCRKNTVQKSHRTLRILNPNVTVIQSNTPGVYLSKYAKLSRITA